MLIGIDGNEANIPNRVGVGRYAAEVLRHLHKTQNSKLKTQNSTFRIYLKKPPRQDLPQLTNWWQYRVIGPQFLWTQIGLPLDLFLSSPRPDVFFSPSHYRPRFSPCPTVISIMDLSYLYFPELFNRSDLYQLRNWTTYSLKKSAKILTISKSTKSDIIKHYGIPAERIVVAYPGYDTNKFKVQSSKFKVKVAKKKFKIKNKYILYVGTLQPRKNIVRLIEAFAMLIREIDIQDFENLQLVIVGKKGWLFEDIFTQTVKLGLTDRIVFTGYVDENDLPALYQGASCFVLPSLYEGFGLTVVEAMACGCPTVVANISSLPEIAVDATILVDPYNSKDIARGIKKVLIDKNLSNIIIHNGLKRIKIFSWERCAQQIYSILKEVTVNNV